LEDPSQGLSCHWFFKIEIQQNLKIMSHLKHCFKWISWKFNVYCEHIFQEQRAILYIIEKKVGWWCNFLVVHTFWFFLKLPMSEIYESTLIEVHMLPTFTMKMIIPRIRKDSLALWQLPQPFLFFLSTLRLLLFRIQ
jgi:hypothetical protein